MIQRSSIALTWFFAGFAFFLFAALISSCGGGSSSIDHAIFFDDIEPESGSTIETDHALITGETSYPERPPWSEWGDPCPTLSCPVSTSVSVAWNNITTGEHGGVDQEIVNSCYYFFGWCRCECVHQFSAIVPLALGINSIELKAFDTSGGAGSAKLSLTRLPAKPTNITILAGQESITISWDPVPDATSYDIYWSTSKEISTSNATKIENVSSPYTLYGLSNNTPYYFLVTALIGSHDSATSDMAWAVPGWPVETIADMNSYRISTAIDTDSAGNPYIHYSRYYYDLGPKYQNYFAKKLSGSWSHTIVGSSSSDEADIVLDNSDSAYLAYIQTNGLYLSSLSSGNWTSSLVTTDIRDNISLDTSPAGHLSIAYRYYLDMPYSTTYQLRFTENSSGTWRFTTLESMPGVTIGGMYQLGRIISLDTDHSGVAHIAYIGPAQAQELRYASNPGNNWSFTTIDTNNIQQVSLASDQNGKVHIVYSDVHGVLRYTTNASGSWYIEQIDNGSYYPSIEVDAAGLPHIVYFNIINDEVRYLTGNPGSWNVIPLDTIGDISTRLGVRTAITVDGMGKIHILYNYKNNQLKYVTN